MLKNNEFIDEHLEINFTYISKNQRKIDLNTIQALFNLIRISNK